MSYKSFSLGALWTNGYLFWDDYTRNAFFIDPGGDMSEVISFMQVHDLNLKMILLTHGHIDHIAGIHEVINLVGNNIYIGHDDAYMLKNPSHELQSLLNVHCDGVNDFKELHEGDLLEFDGFKIQVLETPGHTQGSVCFLITDSQNHSVLVSGDTLFAQSVGRTDLEGGDWLKLEDSLRRLSKLNDSLHVLPGHGSATSIGMERELNPYLPR